MEVKQTASWEGVCKKNAPTRPFPKKGVFFFRFFLNSFCVRTGTKTNLIKYEDFVSTVTIFDAVQSVSDQ